MILQEDRERGSLETGGGTNDITAKKVCIVKGRL